MGKLKNDQSGFGAVETVLVLIIVVLIGVVSFMVYGNQNKDTSTDKPTTNKSESKPVDLLAGGTIYSATDGTFSVKHPKDFLTKACTGNGEYLGLAKTSEGLLQNCEGQPRPIYGSVIRFTSYAKAPGFDPSESPDNYNRPVDADYEASYKHTTVTLNGKTVDKVVSVNKEVFSDSVPGDASIPGAIDITYRYYNDKTIWYAEYIKLKDSENLTKYFEAMVQTWKF